MNNWYVITGAPYAGKTTLVNQLEEKGYLVAHETARLYIDREIAKGRTIEEIRKDDFSFQREILKMKIDLEKSLPKNELVFLDRGIPDSEAYFSLNGKEDDDFLCQAIGSCFYKKIFLLDFFDIEKDYARSESREEQQRIHTLLEKAYQKTGFPIIRIPKFDSKEDRLSFVLSNL